MIPELKKMTQERMRKELREILDPLNPYNTTGKVEAIEKYRELNNVLKGF